MNKNKLAGYALAIALLASCSKDPSTPGAGNPGNQPTGDSTALSPYATALVHVETVANEMEWIASELVVHGNKYPSGSIFFSSASVSFQTTEEGKAFRLTFDNTKKGTDGKKRDGQLWVEIDNSSNSILINLDNYRVNDTAIAGSYFFERLLNPQQRVDMKLTALNGKIGNGIRFSADRTQTMTAGGNTTNDEADDVFENADGTYYLTLTNQGIAEASVETAVKEKYMFRAQKGFTPVAGRIRYTLPNNNSKVLNFGNGSATATPYIE